MFASTGAPRSRGGVLRIGIVDLLSLRPDSATRRVFARAVAAGASELGLGTTGFTGTDGSPVDIRNHGGAAEWSAQAQGDLLPTTCPPGPYTQASGGGSDCAPESFGGEVGSRLPGNGGSRGAQSLDNGCGAAPTLAEPAEFVVDITVFGIDPRGGVDDVDWLALAGMDAVVVSGSEPTAADIAAEPCLSVVERILRECSGAASLLFSCQSAHAALYSLYGLQRYRLARREHGVFDHWVHSAALDLPGTVPTPGVALVEGLATPVRVPHSRWNAMTSAELRAAGVTVLLDSEEAEWHLATGSDGLRHLFLQGHPEYLADTMAREYRRDLRRWLGDARRPFPDIPQRYFARDVEDSLLDQAVRLRTTFDPALLEDFPLPDFSEVTTDWSAQSTTFFANWIRAVAAARRALSAHHQTARSL